MIQAAVTHDLGTSFRRGADEEAYRRALRNHQAVRERDRKRDEARNDAEEIGDFAGAVISVEQAETLRLELETYQTATVEALLENEQALEHVQQQLEALMRDAHVLEDGRRVFKTEDGTRVFDEFGQELDAEAITPDDIDDQRPRWESVSALNEQREALQLERSQLLGYQNDLDEVAERLDSGEMTLREYDELRETLRQSAPDAVRARIPGMEVSDKAPTVQDSFNLDAELAAAIQPTAPSLGG
jgi:hypothetical protein